MSEATREQMLAVFEENQQMLASVERWIDYIAPVGQAGAGNVTSASNNNPRINEAFMATFRQVRFAAECGYTLLDDLRLPPAPAELLEGPGWKVWRLNITQPDTRVADRLLGGRLELRDANPLPEWWILGDNDQMLVDLRAAVGWLMQLIGDRHEPGIVARWWQQVDRNFRGGPTCTDYDASWCPNCGDCTCDRSEPQFSPGQIGDYYCTDYNDLGKPGCRLHDQTISRHNSHSQPSAQPKKAQQ